MITSLDLKDFKCFNAFEKPVSFSKINLLTGSNGRGKSTIFQSILLLAQSFRSGKNMDFLRLNGRNVQLGTFADILRRNAESDRFGISITSDDTDEFEANFSFHNSEQNPRIACLASLGIKYADGTVKELVSSVGGDGDKSQNGAPVASATSAIKVINQLRNVYFISADRQGPRNYVSRTDENTDNVGVHGEYVINTIKSKEGEILKEVVKAISDIMGGASISVKDIDTEYIKILLDSVDQNEGFKPVNVGFGYSYILPIVVLPLIVDEGSKLFIENPEAHLHPGAQSRMMNFLMSIAQKRNLQLFIETHSDHIINSLRIAVKKNSFGLEHSQTQIIHIDREEGSCLPIPYSIKIDKDGNLSDYPKGFMEEWGNQMIELV